MFFIILNILAYFSRKLALALSPKGLVGIFIVIQIASITNIRSIEV